MATVLLVIHLMVAAALVGLVLLQRSEGGARGIGGGGGAVGSPAETKKIEEARSRTAPRSTIAA